MSLLRRAMLYLGLGADEDYDEYGQPHRMPTAGPTPSASRPRATSSSPPEQTGSVRTLPVEPPLRSVNPPGPTGQVPRPQRPTGVVRTVAAPVRTEPTVITPRSYNDAKEIGDTFKNRQPVIINLQHLPPDLGHRLVDFASGLIFALDGQMKKVTQNVFLLTPANVEVDDPTGVSGGDAWE